MSFVAFFVIICYHTPYAVPWIFPPIAFYAMDLALRLFRYRVKDAILESCDTSMTLVHIPDVTGGWIAGQHVQLRVFFGHRIYESHSFTIMNAPPAITNLPTLSNGGTHYGGITLAARVAGDWTRDLNTLAQNGEKGREHVAVLLDGPYGGSSLDFGEYEAVLLISGGSGVTVSLGILDDLLGRIVRLGRPNRERTKRIDVVWCIRSFGMCPLLASFPWHIGVESIASCFPGAILWFAPMFMALGKAAEDSSVDLSFKFYVTCLCDPEAIPPIPNCTVSISKPIISESLQPLLTHAASTAGGVGILASGPESLTRGTQNALAKIKPMTAASVGGIGLHTELFAL
jgi:ferric-chelate reductase